MHDTGGNLVALLYVFCNNRTIAAVGCSSDSVL